MVIATGLLGGISNVSESTVHEVVSTRAESVSRCAVLTGV